MPEVPSGLQIQAHKFIQRHVHTIKSLENSRNVSENCPSQENPIKNVAFQIGI